MLTLMTILKVIGGLLLLIITLGFLVLFLWYQIDGQPSPEADKYTQGKGYISEVDENGDWFFIPEKPNKQGIIILSGALVKPKSYIKSAAYFAQQGYKVWVPLGKFRLSMRSATRITEQLSTMAETNWHLVGHSMGGYAAINIARETSASIGKIVLWASGAPEGIKDMDTPFMYVYGSNDDMVPAKRLATIKDNLPENTLYKLIQGANHRNFALYSHQFLDGTATIEPDQQIDQTHQMMMDFFAD